MVASNARHALSLAIAIKQHNRKLFQEWANRFLPYDMEASEFLIGMADEEQSHEQQLVDLHCRYFGSELDLSSVKNSVRLYLSGLDRIKDHFFVVDSHMALTLLCAAVELQRYTRQFYNSLLPKTYQPEIAYTYRQMMYLETDYEKQFRHRIIREQEKPTAAIC